MTFPSRGSPLIFSYPNLFFIKFKIILRIKNFRPFSSHKSFSKALEISSWSSSFSFSNMSIIFFLFSLCSINNVYVSYKINKNDTRLNRKVIISELFFAALSDQINHPWLDREHIAYLSFLTIWHLKDNLPRNYHNLYISRVLLSKCFL